MTQFWWGRYALFSIMVMFLTTLYLLPEIFPSFIGTGYILIFLGMTVLSVITWQRKIISPFSALILSLLGCLFLAPLLPYTSNDSQRYLWDGAVLLSGLDPYVIAPNDPLVASLREIWPTPEEHAQYPTLYPPGGLILFSLCSLAGPSYAIWIWKIMTTLAVMLSLSFTYKLLILRDLTRHFYLVAFSPLLLFESQIGVHLDIFSVLGVVLALWCLEKEKIILAGAIIGLAATIKFLPAVIVGPFLFYLRPRQAFKLFVSSSLTWLSIYGMMFGLGYKPLGLLPTFFEKWRGGAPVFPVLEHVKGMLGLSSRSFLFCLMGLSLMGFSLSAWFARRGKINLALMLSLAVPLLLSPVLFPWYLLTLIPFLALRPSLTLFLAVTLAPLSYVVLNRWLSEGVWDQATWPAQVLGFCLLIGLVFDTMRAHRVTSS